MKKTKKLLCLFLAMVILIPNIAIFSNAVEAEQQAEVSEPLLIEVTTDKSSYTAYGIAGITVKVTNTSDEAINNISAEAVFEQLAPVGKDNEIFKEVGSLQPNESFEFSYKATVNSSKVKINFFAKIFLWFTRLFNGGYTATSHDIEADIENVTEIKFGKYTVQNVVRVGYGDIDNNLDTEVAINAFTEYFDVKKDINTISKKYENESGYISEKNVDSVLNEVAQYAEEKLQKGLIQEYGVEFENNCVWITLKNGIDFIYVPNIEGLDSVDVSTYQPCLFTYSANIQEKSKDATDGSAKTIQKRINDYNFNNDYDNEEITLDTIKDIKNNQVIIWHGHGKYNTKHHSSLMTSIELDEIAFLTDPIYYLSKIGFESDYLTGRIICTDKGYVCVTHKFFEKYLNNLDNTFIYLGTCSSGKDSVLVDTLINKGAEAVIANTNDIHTIYNLDMIESVFEKMTTISATTNNYYTVNEALSLAKEEHGQVCYGEHNPNTEVMIWGNQNYRFSEAVKITGTVKDSSTNKAIDKLVTIKILNGDNTVINNTKADINGVFSVNVPSGNYTILIECEGYVSNRSYVTVGNSNENIDLGTILLKSNSSSENNTSSVHGMVKDEKTGNAISGVRVEFIDNSTDNYDTVATATTGADGSFSVELPYGSYSMSFNHDDYEYYGESIDIDFENIELPEPILLTPKNSSGGDDDSGEPIDPNRKVIESGNCGAAGDNVKWVHYYDGELVISGTGAMADYSPYASYVPWHNHHCIKSINIGNGVTSIGNYAFKDCHVLTSVTIPNSVTSIGDHAFYSCTSLTSVTIPNSVTSIGDDAFADCTNLTSVTIPNSVTSIGGGAFRGCSSLTSVTIPDSVTGISDYAFEYCTSLTSVTIPDSVTSIGGGAFRGCTSLTSVIIPNSVTDIEAYAFEDCNSLKEIKIPVSAKIQRSSFDGCSNIEKVTLTKGTGTMQDYNYLIPSSYQYTPWYISRNSMKEIIIEEGIKNIGSYAFCESSNITSIIIPNGVTSIGECAFKDCTSLRTVTLPNSITNIEYGTFWGCNNLSCISIPDSVIKIGTYAFKDCASISNIVIPHSVTNIGNSAFQGCTNLISITIPNSVTNIGNYAFSDCSNLTSVSIPNSATNIGNNTFSNCVSLTNIIIPNSINSIGNDTFNGCTSLTSITIPNSITSIGYSAFENCPNLSDVYYSGSKKEWDDISLILDYANTHNNSDLLSATIHYNSKI